MGTGINNIGSGLSTLGQHYRMITNNIANASTVGYKRQIRSMQQTAGTRSAAMGAGELQDNSSIDFGQGPAKHTGRPLDVALHGPGMFAIETPEGPVYTRNGVFHVNSDRQIVDLAGQPVSGEAGPIVVPPDVPLMDVSISRDGNVSAGGQSIGKLKMVEFDDVNLLEPLSGASFRIGQAEEQAATKTTAQQGFQEKSNVTTVEELVDLITVTRLYEANLKGIKTQDNRMKSILQAAMA